LTIIKRRANSPPFFFVHVPQPSRRPRRCRRMDNVRPIAFILFAALLAVFLMLWVMYETNNSEVSRRVPPPPPASSAANPG